MIFFPGPRLFLFLLASKWSPADIDTIDTDKRQIDCVLWLVRTQTPRLLIGWQEIMLVCYQASGPQILLVQLIYTHTQTNVCRYLGWLVRDISFLIGRFSLSAGLSLVKSNMIITFICFQWSLPEISSFLHHTTLDKLWALSVRQLLVQSLKYTATVIPCSKGLWNIKLV